MALGVRSRLYLSLTLGLLAVSSVAAQRGASFPRLADGKPNLQGIWQSDGKPAADIQPFVEGGTLPYKPGATAKKQSNFRDRAKEDPLNNCFMPGVPRIMYLEYPFQIFQAKDHIVFTFEWSSVFRLIYTTAKASPHAGVDSWMGDSRGRWEGDTLVVEVIGSNDRAWLDAAGNYHSDKMRVTERYTMTDPDTIRYEATVTDPEVFTKPWKINFPLHRVKNKVRALEYHCQAEKETKSGDWERDPRTWYPGPGR